MDANLIEKHRIKELKFEYCFATDALDPEAVARTFLPDGSMELDIYGKATGREEIKEYIEWYAERDFGVRSHNIFNPLIEIDGDHATGTWYYIVIYDRPDGSIDIGQGRYTDEYQRTGEGWLIESLLAERRISKTVPTTDTVR